jgi:hypothetical protein
MGLAENATTVLVEGRKTLTTGGRWFGSNARAGLPRFLERRLTELAGTTGSDQVPGQPASTPAVNRSVKQTG